MTLEHVVPWGRSKAEYQAMFDLGAPELAARILDCAAGPASFNAELTAEGGRVISCDPIYAYSAAQIAARVEATYDAMVGSARERAEQFVWTRFGSPDDLGRARLEAMQRFVDDFPAGREQGRYVVGELPELAFEDRVFDLALCSHFLFTYSAHFDRAFHRASIVELCRVAAEVRIFPLLTSTVHGHTATGSRSPHLAPIVDELTRLGYDARVQRVPYEFQRGGNEVLRVVPPR
jgi:hypothetical protein